MARIFISYKRADKAKVFRLKDKIESAIGEPCWIDLDGIESDAQFVSVIIKAINEASIVLFMYSCHHAEISDFDKDWTAREISFAERKNKRIVFVNIDQTPLSDYFEMMYGLKQQIDATSEESFGKLLADLKVWLGVKKANAVTPYTEGLEYEFDDETLVATVKGIGTAKDEKIINIPPYTAQNGKRYSVRGIGKEAFKGCNRLTSIIIPNSVKVIRYCAFAGCSNINSVTIPNSVTEMESATFIGCNSLTSITIPNSVTMIGSYAFHGCSSLTSVTIPNSVTEIGSCAFARCESLTSVEISRKTKVSKDAFPTTCKVIRRWLR